MQAQRADGTQEQPENRINHRSVREENTRQRFGRGSTIAFRTRGTDQVRDRQLCCTDSLQPTWRT